MIFFIAVSLFLLYSTISNELETITVTPEHLVWYRLFSTKTIPIKTIRIVKEKTYGEDNASILFIETNQLKFYMGSGLTKNQIEEAVIYILNIIRVQYPENYEDVMTEHFEVDKFWRK